MVRERYLVGNVWAAVGNVAVVLAQDVLVVVAVEQLIRARLADLGRLQRRLLKHHNQPPLRVPLLHTTKTTADRGKTGGGDDGDEDRRRGQRG